uniref:BglG family transcription antiterminator n=1 Tax=Olsenella timonensis TaxID=1805478 RepID=UPI00094EFE6E|nr:PTS sugar transporter subunit IIA [Olsenella timonensis]
MIELSRRQKACLRYLCRQVGHVTTALLARHLDVSERTVRSDLGAIEAYARERGALIERVPGSGIRLVASPALRSAILAALDEPDSSYTDRADREVAAEVMLLVRPTVTFQQIANLCGVSRQTIVAQCDDIAAFFAGVGIELCREQGVGSSLRGGELEMRHCFMGLVTGSATRDVARMVARRELPPAVLERVDALVVDIERLQGASFVDVPALALMLAYALSRVEAGHVLPEGSELCPPEFPLADEDALGADDTFLRSLRGLLSDVFEQPRERRFAGALVFAQRTTSVGLMHRASAAPDDEAALISRDLISALRELHVIDEDALAHLIDGLTTHLRAAIYRCRNDIQVESELPSQIMVSISLLYDFTLKQMRLAEQRYGVSLNDAEIGYIAMYLDAIYESSARESVVLKVLFVCPFGLASSSVLMTRLSYALAECTVIGPMTEDEARDYVAANQVDLVVSTTDCSLGDVPVVTVDPLLRQPEIERVKSQIMQLSYSKICSYFLRSYSTSLQEGGPVRSVRDFVGPECVQVGVGCDDWRDAIRIAARPLLERGLIEGRYVERMIGAVEDYGPYMVLTPRTAYVHAGLSDGARENCASILVLDHDIPFGPQGEKPVRCVIVLGIHDTERSLLLALAPIFERKGTIRTIGRPDLSVAEVLDLHD